MTIGGEWELQATDESSGRQIYKRDTSSDLPASQSNTGTYDFKVTADFEVRDRAGTVLLETDGTAEGEYWCGVFLWFVQGSNGTKVRLEETDHSKPTMLDVPDQRHKGP